MLVLPSEGISNHGKLVSKLKIVLYFTFDCFSSACVCLGSQFHAKILFLRPHVWRQAPQQIVSKAMVIVL